MKGRDRISGRRYARALLDVAVDAKLAERVRKDLESVEPVYIGHAGLSEALRHPTIPAERKKSILAGVFPDICPLTTRLLELLVERGRFELLPAILQEYVVLWNARQGIAVAETVTAVELTRTEQESLRQALSSALGRKIELRTIIDPSVLGGVMVRAEGQVFEGTIRAQLRALRERLGGASHG